MTAGLAGLVIQWDVASGEMLLTPMATGSGPARSARWSPDGRFIAYRNDGRVARVWDVATAEAVTPMLQHTGYICWAYITPAHRLITGSAPNLIRAWDLKPTLLPAEALTDYIKVLSARQLSANGLLSGIPARNWPNCIVRCLPGIRSCSRPRQGGIKCPLIELEHALEPAKSSFG